MTIAVAPAPVVSRFGHAPVIAIWEATRACDLACRHCRAEAVTTRDPRELSDDEARALFAHLRQEFGPILLVITGGDPLKRPGIIALAAHGAALGLRVAITPAATPLLTADAIRACRDAGIQRLALSLDGADAETHDGFRQVPGTFARTLAALEQARSIGLETQLNTSVGRHNHRQLPAVAALAARHGVRLWSVFILVPMGRARPGMLVDPREHEQVYRTLAAIALDPATPFDVKTTAGQPYYRVLAQERRRRGLPEPQGVAGRAAGVNDGNGFVFIGHDGTICPSGFLPIVCGDVRRDRLADVYRHHPLFVSLRRPEGFAGKCGRCEFNRLCGGSRSRTWALTGDPLGSDPTCVYVPRDAAAGPLALPGSGTEIKLN